MLIGPSLIPPRAGEVVTTEDPNTALGFMGNPPPASATPLRGVRGAPAPGCPDVGESCRHRWARQRGNTPGAAPEGRLADRAG